MVAQNVFFVGSANVDIFPLCCTVMVVLMTCKGINGNPNLDLGKNGVIKFKDVEILRLKENVFSRISFGFCGNFLFFFCVVL